MKCNKKFLAVAAAGALTVATAVPALALENEIHGAFTSFYDLSNYSAAGNNAYETNPTNARGLVDGAPTENYFVQRVRLGYTAKASDNVKLVTQFELDYNWYGNSSYTTERGSGGAIGSDSVNLETKNLYLELNYPSYVNAKIGMMGNTDAFKGVIFDADMAGLLFSHTYANAGVNLGFFRWNDTWDWSNDTTLGKKTADLISLDAKYNVTKDVKVGAAYYYIQDNRPNGDTISRPIPAPTAGLDPAVTGQLADGTNVYFPGTFQEVNNPANSAKVHTIGLNAEGVVGPVTLNGFALAQFGDRSATEKAKGYALNLGAKMALLGGTARSEFNYVAGGKHALYNAAAGTEAGGYYDSELIFLGRDKNATTIDNAIVYDVSNYGQGVILGSLGYDYTFTDRLSGSANAGFAAIANDDNPSYAGGDSNYLGTELNAEANYKLTPNVTLGARGGYVFLGDYFKGLNADNPYDLKIIAKYAF